MKISFAPKDSTGKDIGENRKKMFLKQFRFSWNALTQTGVHTATKRVPFGGTQNSIFRLIFKLNLPQNLFLSMVKYSLIINLIVFYLVQI